MTTKKTASKSSTSEDRDSRSTPAARKTSAGKSATEQASEERWRLFREALTPESWFAEAKNGWLVLSLEAEGKPTSEPVRFRKSQEDRIEKFLEDRLAQGALPVIDRSSDLDFEAFELGYALSCAVATVRTRVIEREGLPARLDVEHPGELGNSTLLLP